MIGTIILSAVIIICTTIIVSDNRRQHRRTRRTIRYEFTKFLKNLDDIRETSSDDYEDEFNGNTYVGNAIDLNQQRGE